jgi:stearoyl-CoA desaturase (delta-9 desaturase)
MEKPTLTQYIKNTFHLQNLWGSIVPMQFIGVYALYTIFTGQAPEWWWIASIIGYVCIAMLGVSAGYHRLFSHRGYKVNSFTRRVLLWFGIISGQGSPIFWIGIHRGYHHRYADRPGDSHSPLDGLWHSYMGWMFTRSKMSIRSVIDLVRNPEISFAHRHYIKIFWGTHLLVALISVDLWLYLLAFPAFITLHAFCINTSLNHCPKIGYRNYDVKDNSINSIWLFPLVLGEAWHNNHHGDGRNANYRKKWWELDPTFWLIQAIRTDKKVL